MSSTIHRFRVQLAWRGRELEVELTVSEERLGLAGLARLAFLISEAWIGRAVADERQAGRVISCTAGCAACCHQLAVVSPPEACHLVEVVEALSPPLRAQVEQRRRRVMDTLTAHELVGELMDPQPAPDGAHLPVAVEYARLRLACPLLDGERCAIYPDRPIACREQLATSPAEHCADPSARPVQKVRLPPSMSAVLAYAAAALTDTQPRLIPLPLAWYWLESCRSVTQQTWPWQQGWDALLASLSRPAVFSDVRQDQE